MTTQQTLRIDKLQLSCRKHGHWHELVHGISLCVQRVRAGFGRRQRFGQISHMQWLTRHFATGVRRTGGQGLIQEGKRYTPCAPRARCGHYHANPRSAFNPVLTMRTHARETARLPASRVTLQTTNFARASAEVGLTDPRILLDLYPFEMSGGMLQRMMIALAPIRYPRGCRRAHHRS